ncbi:MAG: hypothetical protein ACSHX5_01155 [Phycisphaerales bacterium]
MNNGIKALIGAALLSVAMLGCESTQKRDMCSDKAAACAGTCEGEMKEGCCGSCKGLDKNKADAKCCGTCKGEEHGHSHADKKTCGPDCTKPCCA